MGATLPAISRWVKATPDGVAWLGFFYGGNIAGGVDRQPGCRLLSAAHVRRRHRDGRRRGAEPPRRADRVRAGGPDRVRPGSAAGSRRVGAGRHPHRVRRHRALRHDGALRRGGLDADPLAALRRHRLHLLADPGGLPRSASASAAPSARRWRAAHRRRGARSAGASCCCAAPWRGPPTSSPSRCRTGRSIRTSSTTPWFTLQLDLVRCMWVMLPGAMLWGASFPLALAARGLDRTGRGAPGRRRLRRQHRRRDCRLDGDELHPDSVDRQLAHRAGRSSSCRRCRRC